MITHLSFNRAELSVAESWHGGQESMLYAVCSSGGLKLADPSRDDAEEVFADLVRDLESELAGDLAYAQSPDAGDEHREDIPTLQSMLAKCRSVLDGTYEQNLDEFVQGYIECALWSGVLAYVHEDECPYLADDCDPANTDACTCDCGNGPGMPELVSSTDAGLSLDESDLTDACRAHLESDARDFYADNLADLTVSTLTMEQAGHDLWLTRNRRGAGFWDRKHISESADAALDRLTEAAHACGSEDLIVGNDGKVGVM